MTQFGIRAALKKLKDTMFFRVSHECPVVDKNTSDLAVTTQRTKFVVDKKLSHNSEPCRGAIHCARRARG